MKGLFSIFLVVGVLGAIALGIFVLGNKGLDSTRFAASVLPPQPQAQPQTQPEQAPVNLSSSITVKVQPLSVQPGQSITVTIAADKDLSSPIILVDVSLASPSSRVIKASIVDIDGEGNRFGSIDIPADAELGTWRIQTIEIDDRTGVVYSYIYGQDISATFTVL